MIEVPISIRVLFDVGMHALVQLPDGSVGRVVGGEDRKTSKGWVYYLRIKLVHADPSASPKKIAVLSA